MRNKLKAPLPLAEILKKAVKMPFAPPASGAKPASSDPRLIALSGNWPRLVGHPIASNSRPARLAGCVLMIEVTSSVWANELHLLKVPLLEKLRKFPECGTLEDFRCQIATRSDSDKGWKTKPLKSLG